MTRIGRPLHQTTRVPGWSTTPRRTICCPAEPDLYVVLDALRRAKQRETGQRVTLNAMVLELILTHPRVRPKLPASLPEGLDGTTDTPQALDVAFSTPAPLDPSQVRRQLGLLTR